jgi:anaerobic ribonucleoside-triphosphate reductase activating protein
MRYAQIRKMDISNGYGIGVALFVQGCLFRCYNCFNPETWDFSGGKEWTPKAEEAFFNAVNKDYIKRVSFLGGEPLATQNIDTVIRLAQAIKKLHPTKIIWVYTGHNFDNIQNLPHYDKITELLNYVDYVVDGEYVDGLRDMTLLFRGSSNQRIFKRTGNNEWVNVTQQFERG